MTLKEIREWAKARNNDLRLDTHAELFQNNVEFSHYDGTKCRFTNSWVEVQPCDWSADEFFICIFTEHHGWHVYCSDEFRYVKDDKRTIVSDGEMTS
tara:strand:- start:389 stop:679 length:291 start_codon:yes stop_codon:yes gene_type:complete